MKRFKALLYKDFLLLVRDFWGLVLLFAMPWSLVLLMTYLQDSTFRSINENRIPVYLLNADKDSLGNMISRQLHASTIFEISTEIDDKTLTENEVEECVSKGNFLMGIIIPEKSTESLRLQIRHTINAAFNGEPLSKQADSLYIKILIDPATKSSFRTTIAGAMRENALMIQNRLLFSEISRQVNQWVPMPVNLDFETGDIISIQESYAQSATAKIMPNSVQHNVPAWSMFAIFFIVISLAGNMIREREIGCYSRLMTMPCSFHQYLCSKICVYLTVCLLQLALMIATGVYLTPLFDLPALKLGHSMSTLAGMSVSASLAAIGYGLAIGSLARTNQQASIFGAVSVVILAAIGGVWIPVFIMPYYMQLLSRISPLNWGLNGFNDLFVRDSGLLEVMPDILSLWIFFMLTLIIAYAMNRKRRRL